jgi:SAM-dependent methyltransferase
VADAVTTSGQRAAAEVAVGRLPYFDDVFAALERPHAELLDQLIENMHWGILEPGDRADSIEAQLAGAQRLTERVCAIAAVGDDSRILDVGCGFGGTLHHFARRLTGATLVGLNIDRRQLRYIQDHLPAGRGNRVHLVHCEGSCIGLRTGRFDAILAVESLFHLDSRARFFREARRLLKDDGRLVVADLVLGASVRIGDLARFDRTVRADLTRFFGRAPGGHVSLRRYERHAAAVGLDLTTDDNVSTQVIPSLEGLGRLYELISGSSSVRALRALHDMTSQRLLEYHLLGFTPRPGPTA